MPPARQPHPTAAAKEARLSQFMVSHGQSQTFPESLSQFFETLTGAFARCLVADPHKCGIARIITVRDGIIELRAVLEEAVEQMVLIQRLMQPNETTVQAEDKSKQRIGQ